ncbi:unnamed protein product [Periconia digitata]|uniref:Uncharacterized protein n=1 Tax=Periconia digitata TaxID=1303443 RepID=A0A9W4UHS7_9PLEO|nr:unnamed protein product [Periconia digitata]
MAPMTVGRCIITLLSGLLTGTESGDGTGRRRTPISKEGDKHAERNYSVLKQMRRKCCFVTKIKLPCYCCGGKTRNESNNHRVMPRISESHSPKGDQELKYSFVEGFKATRKSMELTIQQVKDHYSKDDVIKSMQINFNINAESLRK